MRRLFAFTVLLLVSAQVWERAHARTPVSTEKLTIVIGYQPLTPTWGATIVTGLKLWKPYLPNVEIERFDSMSGMPLVNNLLADKIDIAYIGDMPAIVLGSKSKLADSRFVAVTEADDGGTSVIYVKKDAPFASIKDLNGKSISTAFGSYMHRFAKVIEAKEGITFNLVGQAPEVGLTNLQTGKVDSWAPWPPYGPKAELQGQSKAIALGTSYGFSSLRGVVVSKKFLEKHPDVVVGWLRAELDGHRIMRERPDDAAKVIFDDWKKFDIPLDVIKRDFTYKVFPDDIGEKWRNVMIDSADFLQKQKVIERVPDWNMFIDDSWLKKAAAVPSALK